jgi:hypothetical protein
LTELTTKSKLITETEVLRCLADEKSLRMIEKIHDGLPVAIGSMNLTRKQYYSRLSKLVAVDLVHKSMGKYRLTSLGKIIWGFRELLATTIGEDYWKFTAIDSLTNANLRLPAEEQIKIISSLIENENLTELLLEH